MAKVIVAALLLIGLCWISTPSTLAGDIPHAESGSDSAGDVLKLYVDVQESGHDDGGATTSAAAPAPTSPEPRAYAQWVAFHISYTSASAMTFLSINNSRLPWGKWYDYPDKDIEISGPDGTTITFGQIAIVAACGRKNSPSGTEGNFDLFADGTTRIANIYFDCPWAGSNVLRVTAYSTLFLVNAPSISPSGAIGDVALRVIYLG